MAGLYKFCISTTVERKIKERRQLGFELKIEGGQLRRFAIYAEEIGHKGPVTVELALKWATLPKTCQFKYWKKRLNIVHGFTKYIKPIIPETEIPPKGLLGPSIERTKPHIYSEDETAILMNATKKLTPANGLRPQTYRTLFGLLFSTGMRIGEALNLSIDDIDFKNNRINIVKAKFHNPRTIPIHSTTAENLKSYIKERQKKFPRLKIKSFFVSEAKTSLKYQRVICTFRGILIDLGWRVKNGKRGPRIYDIRHTFVTRKLLEWYHKGDDLNHKIIHLSRYIGHTKISGTYWYITGVPELMSIAGSRFQDFAMEDNYG